MILSTTFWHFVALYNHYAHTIFTSLLQITDDRECAPTCDVTLTQSIACRVVWCGLW